MMWRAKDCSTSVDAHFSRERLCWYCYCLPRCLGFLSLGASGCQFHRLVALLSMTCLRILLEDRLSQLAFNQSQAPISSCDLTFFARHWFICLYPSSSWWVIGWVIYLPTQLQLQTINCSLPRVPFKICHLSWVLASWHNNRCPLDIRLLRQLFPPHPSKSVSFLCYCDAFQINREIMQLSDPALVALRHLKSQF